MNKKLLSERDICTKYITPSLRQAGWDEMTQLREEVSFTKGRVIVRGKLVTRGQAKRADYILYYKPNIPLAVIEAKDNNCSNVKTRLKERLMEECNLHTIVRLPNSVFKPYASIGTNLLFFEKGEPTKGIWFYEHRVPEGQKAYSMTKPIKVEHFKPCVDWWGGAERDGRVETEVAWRVTADEVKARGYNLDFKNPHSVADDHGDPEELLLKLDEAENQAAGLRDQLKSILEEALLG
jgi:type I restriction-modification system DNA methylase subunit